MSDRVQQSGPAGARDEGWACWSCRGTVAADALFCPTCQVVQPPRQMDDFARLGLSPAFALDEAELDRRYFAFQRRLHPDRFATKSARERAVSQSQAVSVNQAYETLRDPLSRASYLLNLKGVDVNPDGCNTVNDPRLLTEQLERREALLEADTQSAVEAVLHEAERDIAASLARITSAFAAGDVETASHDTTRLKYLVKLAEEARARKAKLAVAA